MGHAGRGGPVRAIPGGGPDPALHARVLLGSTGLAAWVRRQYEANDGVVLLDDAMEEEIDDLLDRIDWSGGIPFSKWKFSDQDS